MLILFTKLDEVRVHTADIIHIRVTDLLDIISVFFATQEIEFLIRGETGCLKRLITAKVATDHAI